MKEKNKIISIISVFFIFIIGIYFIFSGQIDKYKVAQEEYIETINSLEEKHKKAIELQNDYKSKNEKLEGEIKALKNTSAIIFANASEMQSKELFEQAIDKYNTVLELHPLSDEAKIVPERIKEIELKIADIKRKEEEQIRAKEEARKPPLKLVKTYLRLNSISNPEAYIVVENVSKKTVDAYTVGFYCYDRYDKPVNHYLYNTNRYGGLSQNTIGPSKTFGYNNYWTLHGHENTAKIKAVLENVHMTDGTVWEPEYDQEVSIEGTLNR